MIPTAKPLVGIDDINDSMPAYTVELIKRGLAGVGMELKDVNVLVPGVDYRGDVKEARCNPAISIIRILKKEYNTVYVYELLSGDEARQFDAEPQRLEDVEDIDTVVIDSDYKEFMF